MKILKRERKVRTAPQSRPAQLTDAEVKAVAGGWGDINPF